MSSSLKEPQVRDQLENYEIIKVINEIPPVQDHDVDKELETLKGTIVSTAKKKAPWKTTREKSGLV